VLGSFWKQDPGSLGYIRKSLWYVANTTRSRINVRTRIATSVVIGTNLVSLCARQRSIHARGSSYQVAPCPRMCVGLVPAPEHCGASDHRHRKTPATSIRTVVVTTIDRQCQLKCFIAVSDFNLGRPRPVATRNLAECWVNGNSTRIICTSEFDAASAIWGARLRLEQPLSFLRLPIP
jgi:hypothetical protein